MFIKRIHGQDVYFIWPSRTGRIVPNKSVRAAILKRDGLIGIVFGLLWLAKDLGGKNLAILTVIVGLACMIERWFYLSKLKRITLHMDSAAAEGRAAPGAARPGDAALHVTAAEIDKLTAQETTPGGGVWLTVIGAAMTIAGCYLGVAGYEQIPLVFLPILPVMGGITLYVGIRVLLLSKSSKRSGRSR